MYFVLMKVLVLIKFISVNGIIRTYYDDRGTSRAYCVMETFQPECTDYEIIIMKKAVYGRMSIGRCVVQEEFSTFLSRDETTLGCSVDVLSIMDKKCSGRNKCEVRIPDNDLELTKPCYPGLKMYLEAAYECITVIDRDDRTSCTVTATSSFQHLKVGKLHSCGLPSNPWILETTIGKTIQINLFDFSALNPTKNLTESTFLIPTTCLKLGYITEMATKRETTICNTKTRYTELYNSLGNVVQLVLQDTDSISSELLLRFKDEGCSDIIPAEDSWIKREGSSMVIGCYSSRRSWTLVCVNNKWAGVVGNCSHDTVENNVDLSIDEDEKNVEETGKIKMSVEHQIVIVISIVAFGIVACLTTICVGAICVKRFYSARSKKYSDNFARSDGSYYNSNLPSGYHDQNGTNKICGDYNDSAQESKYFVLDESADHKTLPIQ